MERSTRYDPSKDCESWLGSQQRQQPNVDPVAFQLREIANRLGGAHEHKDPSELLFSAISQKRLQIVKELFDHAHVHGNERDSMNRTPLLRAVDAGDGDTVEYLLNNGISHVDDEKKDGLTPLWHALNKLKHSGMKSVAASLIEKADINIKNDTGQYPLLWVIEKRFSKSSSSKRQQKVLSLLLDRKDLDVNRLDSKGRSALHLAVKTNNEKAVSKLLIREDMRVNTFDEAGRTALSLAVGGCSVHMVEILLSRGDIEVCSMDKDGRTPLVYSIICGKVETTKRLLQRDDQAINIADKGGRTPLSWAAEKGSLRTVEFLLNCAGIDKDKKDIGGRTALSWAVENKSQGSATGRGVTFHQKEKQLIVKLLIEAEGIDNNSEDGNGRTPFSWAATNADLSIVKYLISCGRVAIDQPDINRRTPLSWSAEHKRFDVVKCLLSDNAVNANLKDSNGRTPLHWATTCKENQKVMRMLIQKDTDTLYTMILKQPEQPDEVKLLLDAGYKACKPDSDGSVPLHLAVSARNIGSAELLISRGKEAINLRNNAGYTPLKLAVKESPALAKMLVENGAATNEIRPNEWFYGKKDSLEDIICLSNEDAIRTLKYMTRTNFAEQIEKSPPSNYLRRRLFLYKDSLLPWEHGSLLGFKKSPTDDRLHVGVQPDSHSNSGPERLCFLLETSFPSNFNPWYLKKADDSGPRKKSADFLSTLQNSKIPENGAEFFIQFLNTLETRWSKVLTAVEKHIRERIRLDNVVPSLNSYQRPNKTSSNDEFIDNLQSDVSNLYRLRDVIDDHVNNARFFIDKYCFPHNEGEAKQLDIVTQLELQEFTRVSMAEARRSTAIATSMRRLTWMTFIFLPVMLASVKCHL
ncbi:ankyrin repeat domain-containing 50 [Fusarium sporotrichioides]|uniref:Ankyrin repeat domain-containing 50 n=1 Tax=Fusarium sporotrichioides TaxID=5514 RepID=A0A395RT36_FUSSP|nr:ankyrin repeat domain-containing 50 [Fusarium sporotrichioides]